MPKKWVVWCAILLGCLWVTSQYPTKAQIQDGRWSEPFQLSTDTGQASRAPMVVDKYGYVHTFWFEELLTGVNILQYSRFDGENWTEPIDIYFSVPGTSVGDLAPAIDDNDILHLVWREGANGPVYYMNAVVYDTLSAQKWTKPKQIPIPARDLQFKIDSNGVFHILYTNLFSGQERGVYYVRSDDNGDTWSLPYWLDPDIPLNFGPDWPQLRIDEKGNLHALWYYLNLDPTSTMGQWVRYAHSLDGGFTWSQPYTIDINDESSDELRLPNPNIIVVGHDELMTLWAGDSSTHREFRLSKDDGKTWSAPQKILGDLLGQAIGDGLAEDSLGHIHFLGQLRWPHGIYHAVWDGTTWSDPELVYLIARDAFDPRGERIHAHNIQIVVRNGNELVATFTTSPGDLQLTLYTMHRTLTDAPATTFLPTPAPQPTIDVTPTAVMLTPTAVPTPLVFSPPTLANSDLGPGTVLLRGVLPTLLFVVFTVVIWFFRRKRQNT